MRLPNFEDYYSCEADYYADLYEPDYSQLDLDYDLFLDMIEDYFPRQEDEYIKYLISTEEDILKNLIIKS